MTHSGCFFPVRVPNVLRLAAVSVLALLCFGGCRKAATDQPAPAPVAVAKSDEPHSSGGLHASLETDKGTIEIEFFPGEAPKAVENFRLLAERGYYNGTIFHRIVKGFMIQGGDPEGTGRGGKSAWGGVFDDEIQRSSPHYRQGYHRGIVAMANMGPNTNASQFFIMHQDYPLPPSYVIFGQVTRGIEVVDAIANLPTTRGPDGGMSQPVTPAVVRKVTVNP